jgi:hypothetical protein
MFFFLGLKHKHAPLVVVLLLLLIVVLVAEERVLSEDIIILHILNYVSIKIIINISILCLKYVIISSYRSVK